MTGNGEKRMLLEGTAGGNGEKRKSSGGNDGASRCVFRVCNDDERRNDQAAGGSIVRPLVCLLTMLSQLHIVYA